MAALVIALVIAIGVAIGVAIVALRPSPPEPVMNAAIAVRPAVAVPRQAVIAPLPAAPEKADPGPARQEPTPAAAPTPVLAVPTPESKALATTRNETRKLPLRAVVTGPGGAADLSNQKLAASPDMPLSIRKTLPVMVVAVHAYSSTAQDRLVSINGRMLREGDTLGPDLKLEQITPDGMIFTYRSYRFRRGAQ
jgi:general secretion pathway protein B